MKIDESSSDAHISGDLKTPSSKRRNPPPDRLSELPDLALAHILSLLYTEEAARTSVLAKRFNSLWNSVASLTFSAENSGKNGDTFVTFVDTALNYHRRKKIDKFSVNFRYNANNRITLHNWIKFAVEKQVKSLYLNLTPKNSRNLPQFPGFAKVLPRFLCNNENLEELITCWCQFDFTGTINWKSLKLLSVTRAKLSEKLISRVLCGCPVLETLEMREWGGFDKLKIDSVSLKVLRIVGEQYPNYIIGPQEEYSLEISGPNLVSLEVSGSLYRTRVRVSDVGCLENVDLDFEVRYIEYDGLRNSWFVARSQDIVREVLESLCFVKRLTLGGWFIKAVSTCEAYNLSSPRSERRSLTLCIPVINWDHLAIASLLHASPHVETLNIRLSYCSDMCTFEHACCNNCDWKSWSTISRCSLQHCNNCDEEYYWKSWSTISRCPLQHLKTVRVSGFQQSCRSMKPLFQFIEFLLRNSKILEEIVIQASRYVTQETLDEALKLLIIPTASPDVVVLFEPPHLWVDPLCMYQKLNPL